MAFILVIASVRAIFRRTGHEEGDATLHKALGIYLPLDHHELRCNLGSRS